MPYTLEKSRTFAAVITFFVSTQLAAQQQPPSNGIGFLNDLFYGRSYIAAPAELSIPVLL
jgi:hypothetical protein